MLELFLLLSTFYLLVVAWKFPNAFLSIYILLFTEFLGLIKFEWLGNFSTSNILFIFNTIIAIILIIKINKDSIKIYKIILFPILLFIYGIISPIIQNYSTFLYALADGKDFLSYLLIPYLILYSNNISEVYIKKAIIITGLILSIYCIIFSSTGWAPPGYRPSEGFGEIIYLKHASIIPLALLIVISNKNIFFKPVSYLCISLLTIGLAIQPHRSLFLATIFMIAIYTILYGHIKQKIKYALLITIFIITTTALANNQYVIDNIISPIDEILYSTGSIAARDNINNLRMDYFYKSPLIGYGFIDEKSNLGEKIFFSSYSKYSQTLGVVDSGYLDLLIRFGITGTLFLLFFYFKLIISCFINSKDITSRLMGMFLLSYFIINYTWSVMSYNHGIVPSCFAFFISYKNQKHQIIKLHFHSLFINLEIM
jgi:O-antigen ligase